ncbi:hypothetical protein ACRAWD_24570 [Caulobacter segnis]
MVAEDDQKKPRVKDDGPNEVEGLTIQADPRGKVEGNIEPESRAERGRDPGVSARPASASC